MTIVKIETITDAETFVDNSGVADWEFGGEASIENMANWIYNHCNEINTNDTESIIIQYLFCTHQHPKDYGFTQKQINDSFEWKFRAHQAQ